MTNKLKLFVLGSAAIFALVYNWLRTSEFDFDKFQWGLNYFVLVLVLLVITLGLNKLSGRKLNAWHWLLIVPTLWFGFSVFLYSSPLIHFFAITGSIICMFMLWFWLGIEKLDGWKLQKTFPIRLFAYFGSFFVNLFKPYIGLLKGNSRTVGRVIIGIAISIPLLFVFGALFAAADKVFGQWFGSLLNIHIDGVLFWRIVRTFVYFVFFGGVFYTLVSNSRMGDKHESSLYDNAKEKESDNLILSIILGALNVLFVIFIGLQLAFLFGGEAFVKMAGYTYAEYARQGFFQMLFAAVLVLGLVFLVSKLHNIKTWNWARILSLGLIAETLIITASALKRLALYQNAYAYTVSRCLAAEVIVFIAIILITLFIVLISKQQLSVFVKTAFLMCLVFGFVLTAFNMDAYIARKNIEGYVSGQYEKLDLYYLNQLSIDAGREILNLPETLKAKGLPLYKQTAMGASVYGYNNDVNEFTSQWNKRHDKWDILADDNHGRNRLPYKWKTWTVTKLLYWYQAIVF